SQTQTSNSPPASRPSWTSNSPHSANQAKTQAPRAFPVHSVRPRSRQRPACPIPHFVPPAAKTLLLNHSPSNFLPTTTTSTLNPIAGISPCPSGIATPRKPMSLTSRNIGTTRSIAISSKATTRSSDSNGSSTSPAQASPRLTSAASTFPAVLTPQIPTARNSSDAASKLS